MSEAEKNKVSASSCCDYPLPVCGPGSEYIGHGRFVEGMKIPFPLFQLIQNNANFYSLSRNPIFWVSYPTIHIFL
jgi:hypothetical protein